MEELGLAVAIIVGVGLAAQLLAAGLRIPAILPLLLAGFALGPLLDLIHPRELFGPNLNAMIGLAVGVILFEGGMTLQFREIHGHGRAVLYLISLGAAITWGLSALAAYYIAGMPWDVSALFGALVIVTGPTVIGPLLRNVRTTPNVDRVLRWEGILIDVIGALAALLIFEGFFRAEPGEVVTQFARFVLIGALVGAAAGGLLAWTLRRELIPEHLVNVTALAAVFLAFGVSDHFAHESGLLATTLMGVVLANVGVPRQEALLNFKEELVVLLISVLFVVLAANVTRDSLAGSLEWRNLAVLVVMVLLVRPLSVFASTIRSRLNWRERAFVAWIGPRGIVAAAVSSVLAARLLEGGVPGAENLLPLVFTVIVGTGVLASLTARPVARLLLVAQPEPHGFLLVGAHPLARDLACLLQDQGVRVVLADTNPENVRASRSRGLTVYYGSAVSEHSHEALDLSGVGRLLALTPNDEANALAGLHYARDFGHRNIYQLRPARPSERNRPGREMRALSAFEGHPTYDEIVAQHRAGHTLISAQITEDYPLDRFLQDHPGARLLMTGSGGVFDVVQSDVEELPSGTIIVALGPAARAAESPQPTTRVGPSV